MRDLTRGDVRDRQARGREPVAVEPHEVAVADEVQEALVADVVLRTERGALRRRDQEARVRTARAVERAAAHHVPHAGEPALLRGAVRVAVVVGDREVVRELVGVGRHARALGLDRGVALRVGPVGRRRDPRGPRDVARQGPVGLQRVAEGLGAERVRHLLRRVPLHLAELLPGRGLVLTGGDVEDVVVLGDLGRADGRLPGGARVRAEVQRARLGRRQVRAVLRAVARGLVGEEVLVLRARAARRARRRRAGRRTCRRSPPSSTGSWSGSC